MIKLNKLQEPEILRTNKTQWTEDYKTAKSCKSSDLETLKSRYRHPDIKKQILLETSEKCAYCESKIRHIYPGDVEHIKPKSEFEDNIFEWFNLTLSCGECNRRKLANYDEDIGVINPYLDEPDDHLSAHGATIFPRPGDDKGKLCCYLFELNRIDLVERRKEQLEKIQLKLDEFVKAENPLLRKLIERQIENLKSPSNEYAMITRAFIKSSLKKKEAKK